MVFQWFTFHYWWGHFHMVDLNLPYYVYIRYVFFLSLLLSIYRILLVSIHFFSIVCDASQYLLDLFKILNYLDSIYTQISYLHSCSWYLCFFTFQPWFKFCNSSPMLNMLIDLFSNVDIMHCIFLYFSITQYFYVDKRPLIWDPSFIYKIS